MEPALREPGLGTGLRPALSSSTPSILVLVGLGCHDKIPEPEWFKQQTFIFPQFQKLEI
jgi:hypothetical protein